MSKLTNIFNQIEDRAGRGLTALKSKAKSAFDSEYTAPMLAGAELAAFADAACTGAFMLVAGVATVSAGVLYPLFGASIVGGALIGRYTHKKESAAWYDHSGECC
jgi:hypothetical protein